MNIIYPTWKAICKTAENAGGHLPDAIAPAVCFDLILWDTGTGEIWIETRIAADYDNFRAFADNVHCVGTAWSESPNANEIVSRIASITCPHTECPCSENGMPVCDMPPLCKHADSLKRDIIFGRVKTADI